MARRLRMWEMTPDLASEGTVTVFREVITPREVEDRLKDMLDRSMGQTADLVIVHQSRAIPQCVLMRDSSSW
jgi:hypothetical protein